MQVIPVTYFEQPHPLVLGQFFEGGLVANLSGSFPNQKAMIVSMDWIGVRKWGTTGVDVVGTSYDAFTGVENTDLIIASEPTFDSAAKLAKNYNGGGFTDWCLPSADDIAIICANRVEYLLAANWESNNFTWTSTQYSSAYAYWLSVRNGVVGCTPQRISFTKNGNGAVRPVRYVQTTANQQQF